MVGEHSDPWILADVAQPLQGGAGLRLLVDGRVDGVTVDRKGDHHHVRTPPTISGSQARDGHGEEPGPRIAFGKPHAEDITIFALLAAPGLSPASGRLIGSSDRAARRLSSVGQSDALVMRRSSVRFR